MAINVVHQQLTGMAGDISDAVASSKNREISLSAPSPEVFGDPGVATAVGTSKDVLQTAVRALAGNAEGAAESVRVTAAEFVGTDGAVAGGFAGASATGGGQAQ